ncbi:hypothetical protein AB0I53_36220 [Saccharopolyspora sp. NPDC050389]|uniref:hypothetical protein n=1 Tax=Saccharopolyspora sp. NPDC050389 TaxID=3155516 RepID=UPI0033CFEAFF
MATRGAWSRSPWVFFVLVFALGAPFVLLGELSDVRLPANLPLSALQFVVPLVAAAILVGLNDGAGGVRRLSVPPLTFRASGGGSGTRRSCSSCPRSRWCRTG